MSGSAHDRESGAVAVLVSVIILFLVIPLAAVVMDIGNAYAAQRKLSVAADAAALAAAADVGKIVVAQANGCTTTADGGNLTPASAQTNATAAALATATAVNGQNDLSGTSTVDSVTVTCSSNVVQVKVSNSQNVKTIFGGIVGIDASHPQGQATARVFSADAYTGLRPIAACANTVSVRYNPKATPAVQQPFLVFLDKEDLGALPPPAPVACSKVSAGQWDVVNFLDQGAYGTQSDPCAGGSPQSGGNGQCQADWLANGFQGPVYLPNPQAYVNDPALRTDSADPGLLGNSGISSSNAFKDALDNIPGKVIQLPVVDWLSNAKVAGKQVGDRFGLVGVVTVRVCATYDKNLEHVASGLSAADCGGYLTPGLPGFPSETAWWGNKASQKYALWVYPINYVGSGVVGGPRTDCTLFQQRCSPPVVQLYK